MELTGSTFVIRPWRAEDAESLAHYADNRKVWRNMGNTFPNPYTLEDAYDWLERCRNGAGGKAVSAIEIDEEACGGIGVERKGDVHLKVGVVGYWLGEPFWGRGTATEALRLVTQHAFERGDYVRLQASVFGWNPASGRVLEKAGYTLEGRLRNAVFKDGETTDELIYGNLKDRA